ncbi:phosphoribosylanthranilate isomerase [Elizabethkingia ursingii]|uniref:phosphoribosylanthranilate isomerase n=1 Tax=Elizabethkingia ursingii TaxID=1756150 RepID=UPI002012F236|nr:phosphoribosylanthranilate isomerase [Elizabethkingia ursingii]MCL1668862.1 phosphoribosylanthranilate isomerase [Elizabethkingia ursingii]
MENQNHYPKLKVCGLAHLDQIQELQKSEVDFLGFIFYPKSPRYVLNHSNLEQISEIKHSGKVGVFVNEDITIVSDIAKQAHLNYIQLHGDENIEYILNLKKLLPDIQIIKVFRIGQEVNTEALKSKITAFEAYIDLLLFDTDSKAYGGTGETFNWSVLDQLNLQKPYLLSGGISSENIATMETLKIKPFALDINSKFENSPGDKDLDKIQEFIQHIQHL